MKEKLDTLIGYLLIGSAILFTAIALGTLNEASQWITSLLR